MRDKVADLSRQIDQGVQSASPTEALESECRRLRSELQEKERE